MSQQKLHFIKCPQVDKPWDLISFTMMSVPSVVTVQKMLHLRGTITEAISTKPQSVFAISPYFSVFSRKKLQDEGKGKSWFPRISPYFPMFPPLPAYEYTAMQEWSCGRMPMGNLIVCLSPGTYLNTCQTSAEESGRSLSAVSSLTSWPFYRK